MSGNNHKKFDKFDVVQEDYPYLICLSLKVLKSLEVGKLQCSKWNNFNADLVKDKNNVLASDFSRFLLHLQESIFWDHLPSFVSCLGYI